MLVLSRQRDETIMIGDDIEITVVDIRGDKVRLGIAAPSRIAVHRKEVYEAIKRENEQAAGIDTGDLRALTPNGTGRIGSGPQRRSRAASLASAAQQAEGPRRRDPEPEPKPGADAAASANGRRTA